MSLVSSILGDPVEEPPFGQQPSVTQRRAVWTFQLEKESNISFPTIPTKPCRRVPKKIHDYLLIVNKSTSCMVQGRLDLACTAEVLLAL